MRRFAAALIASTLVLPASAHMVPTRDGPTCTAWTAARPAKAARLEAWLLGYVSGLSQERDYELPAAYTSAAIVEWVDRYCKANPRHGVALAGVKLFSEIRRAYPPREAPDGARPPG